MAQHISLTKARDITTEWNGLHRLDPYLPEFHKKLDQICHTPEFYEWLSHFLIHDLTINNIDLLCYVIEEYFPNLFAELTARKHIYYIQKRIDAGLAYLEKRPIEPYLYAFPDSQSNRVDRRAEFLISILNYIDLMDSQHHTIAELLDTPLPQYEQMVQYISYFQHPKVPTLLEKMSCFDKAMYALLTIRAIGYFKNKEAVTALKNLQEYYRGKNDTLYEEVLTTLQKLAFNRPPVYL